MTTSDLETWLVRRIAEVAGVSPEAVGTGRPFASYGLGSRDAVSLAGELEELLGRELPPTLVYDYPTIAALSRHLSGTGLAGLPARESADVDDAGDPIAIIGIACRFPGAPDPESFWKLLRDGVEAIREVPASRWDREAYYHPDPSAPGKTVSRWGGFLPEVAGFDAFFFGISPGEAERMDPQQRLLLELAWEAFEDAGYPLSRLAGSSTGVFAGISINEYGLLQAARPAELTGHSGTGNALSIAANRISYFFDLRGPSLAIDTACSSSLAAVHLACRSLRSGESALALAGGVNLILSPAHSIAFTKAGVLSSEGRCKTFDAGADGYVRGEGGGLVVLKPLGRAVADGDTVYAVIRGSAIGQDGRTNGLMAPSRESQEHLLVAAYQDARVAPGRVQYVEAHGTATQLGDAIEARALGAVLSRGRDGEPCHIGSVKSNLGHLEAAAGIAGLLKVVLALGHRAIPPTLHVRVPNPLVPFSELGLRIQDSLSAWPRAQEGMLAGVSSFGFGGTNVHLVVSDPPPVSSRAPAPCPPAARATLLPVSARTPEALAASCRSFRALLAPSGPELQHLAANAAIRRNHLDLRVAFLGDSPEVVAASIDEFLRGQSDPGVLTGHSPARSGPVFVFSGQGGQWAGMGRELLQTEPVFRDAIARCERALQGEVGWSLVDQLDNGAGLGDIDVVQPALFALQVGLAELWRSWGIEPAAVVGHSLGEVAAACVTGALTLDDAARVICARSRLLKRLSGTGGMAVVGLSAEETAGWVARTGAGVAIAASNSPRATVVSGEIAALTTLLAEVERAGVFGQLINVDVPSHGPLTYPLRAELRSLLDTLRPGPASAPFYSTVTGDACAGQLLTAEYWADNLSEPVQFETAIARLARAGHDCFLEVGPHPVLRHAIQQGLVHRGQSGLVLASLERDQGARAGLLRSLGELYASGARIAWQRVYPEPAPRIRLPGYPWERVRYWIPDEAGRTETQRSRPADHQGWLGHRTDLADPAGARLWQTTLDPREIPVIDAHRVKGAVVLPVAAFVDLALAAGADAGWAGPATVHDLVIAEPMVFPDGSARSVQVTLSAAIEGSATVRVYSRDSGFTGTWTLHASASLHEPESRTPTIRESMLVDSVRSRCRHRLEPGDLYRELEARGLRYGRELRRVTELWRRDGEAIGRIALDRTDGRRSHHQVEPALLDAALQVLAATRLAGTGGEAGNGTWVPVGFRRLQLHQHPARTVWSHALLLNDAGAVNGRVEADVRLLDESGAPVGEVEGLALVPLADASDQTAVSDDGAKLYGIHWQQSRAPVAPASFENSEWLVLGNPDGIGAALTRRIRNAGGSCEFLLGDDRDGVRAFISSHRSPVRGVIDVRHAERQAPALRTVDTIRATQPRRLQDLIELVQTTIANSAFLGTPKLWLVTCGAQPVQSGELPAIEHAPLWGLAKSLRFELPSLGTTAVDLDPDDESEAAAELLCQQLGAADGEDQIAIRSGRRLVPRLRPYSRLRGDRSDSRPFSAASRFSDEAAYLICGGLGGLGLTVARWMVDRGARHLVLAGRREPSSHVREAVAKLERDGARVMLAAVDIAREHQVADLFERLRLGNRPLRGVIHAAGVLDNAAVLDLDPERLRRVMEARVEGSWNLHAATRHEPLDFFVFFSSAVSVLGSPGQGNYAGGTGFMDALAHYRQSLGLPALSINWGPWAQVGLVAGGVRVPGPAGSQGVKGLEPPAALEAFGRLLEDGAPQATVLPFDIQQLLDLYPPAAGMPFFDEVGGRESHVSRLYARPRMRQGYVAPRNELERQLADLWKQTLRIDQVGVHDSFFELGGDSVLAAQVVALAQRTFGVPLDVREAFQAFTIAHLAERLASSLTPTAAPPLTPAAAPSAKPAAPVSEPDEVPLSFVQERQLFLELLEPMTAANNLAMGLHLEGRLDLDALRRSADTILERHHVLRTGFTLDVGTPRAAIAASLHVALEVVDIPPLPNRLQAVHRLATQEAGTPFDLSAPPLLRVRLFRLSETEHVLLLVIHHGIADGWSLGVFLRELFTLYRGGSLPGLPLQYADYAAAQRRSIDEPRLRKQLAFWKEQLGGELPVLELPIDRPRPPRQTFSGAVHRLRIPPPLTERLRQLGRSRDATLFMTLLAAFKAVLSRMTGQLDVLVGTPVAGRLTPELMDLIGPFINTLVLRTDLSGNPNFNQLLDRVRRVALAAYAHQDLPFERLVAELKPPRDLSRTPVFQVLFVHQNTPWPDVDTLDLTTQRLPVERGAAQFDLTVEVTESAGGLDAMFEYNSDLFDRETIAGLGKAYELLLQDAVADPGRAVSELAVITAEERTNLVTALNRTAAPYPRDHRVEQLFAAQVRRVPARAAVECDGDVVSYEALDAWSNRIAHDLREAGVGPGVVAAVLLDRSAELVAALLAVLKAGGAYLPIDPDCPADRLDFIVRDAGARLLLTTTSGSLGGIARFSSLARPDSAEIRRWLQAGPPPLDGAGAENLAYLIYTSGSTGRPKGVEVEHGSLVNLLCSLGSIVDLEEGQALVAVTSIGFDIAALEVFLPLIRGATVIMATRAVTRDGQALAAALAEPRVRAMQATPATWEMLLRSGWQGRPGLTALCGGEALPPVLANRLGERVGVLWNMYGPSETTIWSSAGKVERGEEPISVGRPLANTRLYILDSEQRLVPFGAVGELAIGGHGVARGYRNLLELTTARFRPDPFVESAEPRARLFLTGDRARYLKDGKVQLLGRLDDQMKVNGYRIEPGEIEAALCRHPGVRQAAVVLQEGAKGSLVLVAYYVPAGANEDSCRLRGFLRDALPAYMIPLRCIALGELPLTPSGKVDRRALPPLVSDSLSPSRGAESVLEQRLASWYAAALGLDRVGVDENFFDLGGGSLQIIEIISRARDEGLALTPELFFEHQDIAALASHLEVAGESHPVAVES
jgi:amino acid adenylation domain-containing protein